MRKAIACIIVLCMIVSSVLIPNKDGEVAAATESIATQTKKQKENREPEKIIKGTRTFKKINKKTYLLRFEFTPANGVGNIEIKQNFEGNAIKNVTAKTIYDGSEENVQNISTSCSDTNGNSVKACTVKGNLQGKTDRYPVDEESKTRVIELTLETQANNENLELKDTLVEFKRRGVSNEDDNYTYIFDFKESDVVAPPEPWEGESFKLLEIIDNGESQIAQELEEQAPGKFEVTTMRMKKFVAMRDELNGQYDGVVISSGDYNPYLVPENTNSDNRNKWHDTYLVMNDITNLRAEQIINEFIKKGQLFIFDGASISKSTQERNKANEKYSNSVKRSNAIAKPSILNEKFNAYTTNNKHIYRIESANFTSDAATKIIQFFNENGSMRPTFTLKNQPSPYTDSEDSHVYTKGETIEYTFEINDDDVSNYEARLYIDSDFNGTYENNEVIVTKEVIKGLNTIEYKLPMGYSGLRYWKLEVVNNAKTKFAETAGVADVTYGAFQFKDHKLVVNVLQIADQNKSSDLNIEANMKKQFLSDNEKDYEIRITTTNMNDFSKDNSNSPVSYRNISNYNMLLFGFKDTYGQDYKISDSVHKTIKDYVASGQSIMFTHDIFYGGSNWKTLDNKYYLNITGQTGINIKFGDGAVRKTELASKVNEGLLTQFPFKLPNQELEINTTHGQYYSLDLEDPTIYPWYNTFDSGMETANEKKYPRDFEDSWNNYYTYSKGNITFSGTGHTNTKFPDEEKQLFVNTMYRAFLGANSKPLIDVILPETGEGKFVPSNQNIPLSYQLDDLDLKDTHLKTRVYLTETDVTINSHEMENVNRNALKYENNSVLNHTVPPNLPSLEHNKPNGGKVKLTIVAEDPRGATTYEEVIVDIVMLQSSVDVTRQFTNVDGLVKVGDTKDIQYTITPKVLAANVNMELKGIQFKEVFPQNIDVSIPNEYEGIFSKSVQTNGTTIVTGTIPTFNFVNGKSNPYEFLLQVTPKKASNYVLKDSKIVYKDYTDESYTLRFEPLTFEADIPIQEISLPSTIRVGVGMEKNLRPSLVINPTDGKFQSINWAQLNGTEYVKLNSSNATGLKPGSAEVEVTVTDRFGNVFTAKTTIVVEIPITNVTVNNVELFVNENKTIPITVQPLDGMSSLTIQMDNPTLGKIQFDREKNVWEVKGLKAGTTKIIVSGNGFNEYGDSIRITAEGILTVKNPNFTLSPSSSMLYIGESVTLQPNVNMFENLIWNAIGSPGVINLTNNVVTGLKPGQVTVNAMTEISKVTASASVIVWNMKPKQMILTKGSTVTIEDIKSTYITFLGGMPSFTTYRVSVLDPYVASWDSDKNILRANHLGQTSVRITFDNHYAIEIPLTVKESGTTTNPEGNRNWY